MVGKHMLTYHKLLLHHCHSQILMLIILKQEIVLCT